MIDSFNNLSPLHKLWQPARVPLLLATRLLQAQPDSKYIDGLSLDPRIVKVSRQAAHLISPAVPLSKKALSSNEYHIAQILAGIILLAQVLDARNVGKISVDMTRKPITIQAGLTRALAKKQFRLLGLRLYCTVFAMTYRTGLRFSNLPYSQRLNGSSLQCFSVSELFCFSLLCGSFNLSSILRIRFSAPRTLLCSGYCSINRW